MDLFRNIALVLLVLFCGCEKDPDVKSRDYAFLVTLEPEDNDQSGVTLVADVYHVNNGIVEYGFVISKGSMPTINDYVLSKAGTPDKGEYSQRIDVGLTEDERYYTRAFARSDNQIVYGNEIAFRSEGTAPPEILGFSPLSGHAGDELTITGRNFSPYIPWNQVYFDNRLATVISATENRLVVLVPDIAETREVIISIRYGVFAIDAPVRFNNIYP